MSSVPAPPPVPTGPPAALWMVLVHAALIAASIAMIYPSCG